MTLQKIAGYVP